MDKDDSMLKDPLEKISGTVRKAVSLNRNEVGGLRNTVTQIKRDRHRSVSKLSKQQEAFLKKQTKLLPALRFVSQVTSLQKSRRISRVNEVIPLHAEIHDQRSTLQSRSPEPKPREPMTEPLPRKISTHPYRVLPPIRKQSQHEKLGTEQIKKQRRMSEYQKEYSSLQQNLNNAHKFSQQRLGSSPTVNDSLNRSSDSGKHSSPVFPDINEQHEIRIGNQTHAQQRNFRKFSPSFSTNARNERRDRVLNTGSRFGREFRDAVDQVAAENSMQTKGMSSSAKPKRDAKGNWSLIRNRMRYLLLMEKRRESKYLDELFEEIRSCRYIRKHPNQEKMDELIDERNEIDSLKTPDAPNGIERKHSKQCFCYLCSVNTTWQR